MKRAEAIALLSAALAAADRLGEAVARLGAALAINKAKEHKA